MSLIFSFSFPELFRVMLTQDNLNGVRKCINEITEDLKEKNILTDSSKRLFGEYFPFDFNHYNCFCNLRRDVFADDHFRTEDYFYKVIHKKLLMEGKKVNFINSYGYAEGYNIDPNFSNYAYIENIVKH